MPAIVDSKQNEVNFNSKRLIDNSKAVLATFKKLTKFLKKKTRKGNYAHVSTTETDGQTDYDDDSLRSPKTHGNKLKLKSAFEIDNTSTSNSISEQRQLICISNRLRDFILAWISMCFAILSSSTIGPMFKYMDNNNIKPILAASWRCQCMAIWLLPFTLLESFLSKKEDRVPWFEYRPGLRFPVVIHVLIAGFLWAGNLMTWVVGLQYTSTVRASLFSSLHPLMLVVILYFNGTKASYLEWIGIIVSILGIAISSLSGIQDIIRGKSSDESDNKLALVGDFLCIVAAFNEAVIILNRHKIKKYVPLMQYTFITTMLVVLTSSLGSVLFETDMTQIFCFQDSCIFGWASHKWSTFMLAFGLYVGLFCMCGFNYAMQYISPLVFSSISLVDPIVTGVLSWVTGLEGIPKVETWIGGAIIITGVGVITFGEHNRSKKENSDSKADSDNETIEIKFREDLDA